MKPIRFGNHATSVEPGDPGDPGLDWEADEIPIPASESSHKWAALSNYLHPQTGAKWRLWKCEYCHIVMGTPRTALPKLPEDCPEMLRVNT